MSFASRLLHRHTSEHRASNTHCVPQPFVGGKKGPQRVTSAGTPADLLVSEPSNLSGAQLRWGGFPFDILINRLIRDQHEEIRRELLRIQELSAEAVKHEHIDAGKLRTVGQLVGSLVTSVVAHMNAEEKTFPVLLKLELAYLGEGLVPSHRNAAREALRSFSRDHEHFLKYLQDITRRADSIATPAQMTPIEHDLSARLKTLHRLLLKHCYFETNALFARAAQMEAELFR